MIVEEVLPGRGQILATDIDENSLIAAASGRYSKDDIKGVPRRYMKSISGMKTIHI